MGLCVDTRSGGGSQSWYSDSTRSRACFKMPSSKPTPSKDPYRLSILLFYACSVQASSHSLSLAPSIPLPRLALPSSAWNGLEMACDRQATTRAALAQLWALWRRKVSVSAHTPDWNRCSADRCPTPSAFILPCSVQHSLFRILNRPAYGDVCAFVDRWTKASIFPSYPSAAL